MSGESSSDVIFIESHTSRELNDKPILKLFESLIGDDTKNNTVLTNAQIVNILRKEFDIDVYKTHLLEIEIYINIVKKYLKDWPKWDNFDSAVMTLKSEKNYESINGITERYYLELKKYLQGMLKVVENQTPSFINKLPRTAPSTEYKAVEEDKIVMEVHASRAQFNNLILRHPILNNHIFNCNEPTVELYDNAKKLSLKSILNWCGINIEIKLPWSKTDMLLFKYENRHKLQHSLVNKKLQIKPSKRSESNHQWQVKLKHYKVEKISKWSLLQVFDNYAKNGKCNAWKSIIKCMHETIQNLIQDMPSKLSVPADFRKCLCEYNFVRYMYKDVTESISKNGENFDIQLEEIISPMCQFNIGLYRMKDKMDMVRIQCTLCQSTFKGPNIVMDLEKHFKSSHVVEPDWQCMNCQQNIPASTLAEMNFQHKCISQNEFLFEFLTD